MEKIKQGKDSNNVIAKLQGCFREVTIQGLNETINLISSDEKETMDFLLDRAYAVYMNVRTGADKSKDECQ